MAHYDNKIFYLRPLFLTLVRDLLRPGSDAELFMSRTLFELRPTQII